MNDSVIDFLQSVRLVKANVKDLVNIYRFLEKKYISANKKDLLNSLLKEKDVIFSYFDKYSNLSLKQVKAYINELEDSYIDMDQFDELYKPTKSINLVKLAYKDNIYSINSDELSNPITTKNQIYAMQYLKDLVPRLSLQDSMNILNHTQNCGKFCVAKDYYISKKNDDTDYNLQTRYLKEAPTNDGDYTGDNIGTFSNPYIPVSRQFAAEGDDIKTQDLKNKSLGQIDVEQTPEKTKEEKLQQEEDSINAGNVYVDQDGEVIIVTAVDKDSVILSNNDVTSKDQIKKNIESGNWKRQAADNKEISKLLKQMEKYAESLENKLVIEQSIEQIVKDLKTNLENKAGEQLKNYDEMVDKNLPKIKKLASSIESISRNDEKSLKSYTIVKEKFGNVNFQYTPEYERETVVNKKVLDEILKQMEKLVTPRNIQKFEELEQQLYKYSVVQENIKFSLDDKNSEVQEKIQDKIHELRKGLKSAKQFNDKKLDDNSYEQLDKLISAGKINFDTYNSLTDCMEKNSALTNVIVNKIYATLSKNDISSFKITAAGILQSIKDIFVWIGKVFGFVTIQEAESKKLADLFEQVNK